ncbi:MAG: hypothetical protein HC910_08390 [Spirulinaceae cyanobacterium SM2_1_0]|nr:hypothetical protein [Spirulinaceae cyanobacterium SM2_1_0]
MNKPVILTVDDDPEVLQAIARDLRRQYGERYRILRTDRSSAWRRGSARAASAFSLSIAISAISEEGR